MNPTQLPTDGTLPLLVLQIVSISGEFPAAVCGRDPTAGGLRALHRHAAGLSAAGDLIAAG